MAADIQVSRAGRDDLPEIARLARMIWNAHYPGIIPREQIDYMLDRMYAIEQMAQEIEHGGVHYFLARRSDPALGFAAVGPTPVASEFKLHKLYVLPECHRQGVGRALLRHVCADVDHQGGRTLVLAVNKANQKALAAYRRYGFRERQAVRVDIGGGFVMDDFILAASLPDLMRVNEPGHG